MPFSEMPMANLVTHTHRARLNIAQKKTAAATANTSTHHTDWFNTAWNWYVDPATFHFSTRPGVNVTEFAYGTEYGRATAVEPIAAPSSLNTFVLPIAQITFVGPVA
jgi:hypothetical protein